MKLESKTKEVRVPKIVVTEVTITLSADEARNLASELNHCSGNAATKLWDELMKVLGK